MVVEIEVARAKNLTSILASAQNHGLNKRRENHGKGFRILGQVGKGTRKGVGKDEM